MDELPSGWSRVDIDWLSMLATRVSRAEPQSPFGSLEGPGMEVRRISFRLTGVESGLLDIDEIHLSGPRASAWALLESEIAWSSDKAFLPLGSTSLLSDPSLRFKGTLRLAEDPAWTGRFQAQAGLLWLDLQGIVEAQGDFASLPALAVTHLISLPIGAFQAKSRFSSNLGLGWNALESIRAGDAQNFLSLQASAAATPTLEETAWSLSARLGAGPEALELLASFGRKGRALEGIVDGSYMGEWLYSWPLRFRPGDSADNNREMRATLSLRRRDSGLLDASVEGASFLAGTGSLGGFLLASLQPAIDLGPEGGFSITPHYLRRQAFSISVLSSGLPQDLSVWGQELALAAPFWTALPILEFFSDTSLGLLGSLAEDPLSHSLESEAGCSLERSGGLGWWDLLVPIRARWMHGSKTERRGSALAQEISDTASLEHAAVDIFGRLGSHALTHLWDRDEYGALQSLKISRNPLDGEMNLAWTMELLSRMEDLQGGGFRMGERFDLTRRLSDGNTQWSQRFEAEFRRENAAPEKMEAWRRAASDWLEERQSTGNGPHLPFLRKALDSGMLRSTGFLKAGCNLSAGEGGSLELPLSAGRGLKLGSALDAGLSLSTTGTWNFGQPSEEGFSLRFSLQAGLSLKF